MIKTVIFLYYILHFTLLLHCLHGSLLLCRMLQHDHLVHLYGVCTSCSPILIVTEYMKNGNYWAFHFTLEFTSLLRYYN